MNKYKYEMGGIIRDTETDLTYSIHEMIYLLNNQDKRINELNTRIVEEMELSAERRKIIEHLTVENKNLEQQLHDLLMQILEDIKNELETSELKLRIVGIDGYSYTSSFLDKIYRKYKMNTDEENKRDERIKHLEDVKKELEIKLDECGTELVNAKNFVSYLEKENRELKEKLVKKYKEQNQKAIEQLEKVKAKAMEEQCGGWSISYKNRWDIINDIDEQIDELKGEV